MTNPQTHSEQAFSPGYAVGTTTTETDTLARHGFTQDEIISLLWLQQWYQHGGSDRVEVVRRLEFVRQLVADGAIER
jgi:hypothetical protein